MATTWLKNIISRKSSQQNKELTASNSDRNDLMELFTEEGEQVLIEREEYRKNVLLYNIELNWDNEQKLYETVHGALRDDFYEDILEASSRLLEIDQNSERSYCIASIVLMKNRRTVDARALLEGYIKQHGSSAIILTNLAKTYEDIQTSKEILWQGILLDPNSEHSLGYWLNIIHEQGGLEKYQEVLEEVMLLPNSWLAHMYLAFVKLEARNLSEAMPLIQHVLNTAPEESQVLFGLSGELGKNGYYKEIIELILPRYTPGIGARDGVIHNVLSTFCELKMPTEGLDFIKQVRASFKAQTTLDKMQENLIEEDLKKHEKEFKLMASST